MIAELVAGGVLLGAAISGWVAAYRARGESRDALRSSNAAAAAMRIAEVATEAERRKTDDARAQAATSAAELRVAGVENESLRSNLRRAEREKRELHERLAKLGAPVGDLLVDDVFGMLYEVDDPGDAEAHRDPGSGASRDPVGLPRDPADASDEARTGRVPR